MRIYNNILFVLLLIFSQAICSCNEDDEVVPEGENESKKQELDYTLPASGSITVTSEDGSTSYVREVQDAGYRAWSDNESGNPSTLWLEAFFKEGEYDSVSHFWSNHRKIVRLFLSVDNFQQLKVGTIANGGEVRVRYCISNGRNNYDVFIQQGEFSGNVNITRFELNKTITIMFADCVFRAYEAIEQTTWYPTPTATTGTFYGEITFPLRKHTFFR